MTWQHVTVILGCGLILFGCLGLAPVATLLILAAVGWYIRKQGGSDG
jgi:hypothetical protein